MSRSIIRSLPDDWRTIAPQLTVNALRRHYSTGAAQLHRWTIETGVSPAKSRAVQLAQPPANFLEIAQGRSARQTAKLLHRSEEVVGRWYRQASLRVASRPVRDIPADFAAIAPTLTRNALAGRFGLSHSAVDRMLRELGVNSKPAPKSLPSHRAAPLPQRDDSLPGIAAEHLRRRGWVPVCRARTVRSWESDHVWLVGRLKLSTVEMIAKARASGMVA